MIAPEAFSGHIGKIPYAKIRASADSSTDVILHSSVHVARRVAVRDDQSHKEAIVFSNLIQCEVVRQDDTPMRRQNGGRWF